MFLKSIELQRDRIPSFDRYPFTIPSIQQLDRLELRSSVTFFIGENGSGKSTLLEGIADKCEFPAAGGGRNNTYDVHASESALGDYLRLSWMPKVTNGFFLRAESFYHFASYLDQMADDDGMPDIYEAYGGRSLHEQSHGESFLSLFTNRFGRKGLYLLDEPEAALSPQRQLAFLRIMHDLVKKKEAQFIIATHSPILMGFPDASIVSFDGESLKEIAYDETDHVQITRYFMQHREDFLRRILEEEEGDR